MNTSNLSFKNLDFTTDHRTFEIFDVKFRKTKLEQISENKIGTLW